MDAAYDAHDTTYSPLFGNRPTAMKASTPDYVANLKRQHQDYELDMAALGQLGSKINEWVAIEKHPYAVICQCQVAWEIMNSVHCLVAYDHGLAALGLSRNLFEVICGTIYLVQHPEKTQDFIDYGKKIAFEVAESMGATPTFLAAFRKQADSQEIQARFGKKPWHNRDVKFIVEEAGMSGLYKSFYKESSSIAHGDSYPLLEFRKAQWRLTTNKRGWTKYCATSLNFTIIQMSILYHFVVYWLKLPYIDELERLKKRLIERKLMQVHDMRAWPTAQVDTP